jgi:phosphate transport system substrate-binding protein
MRRLVFAFLVCASAAVLVMAEFPSISWSETTTANPPASGIRALDSGQESAERLLGPKAMVQWLTPARPSYAPPTDKDREVFKAVGRQKPTPEILQPTLDPALPAYQPRTDINLAGNFKGRTPFTSPGQLKAWIEGFRRYYPNVNLDLSPPFPGSTGARDLSKGEADFIIVTRELKPEDYRDFKAEYGEDPLVVPVSGGSWRHVGFSDAEVFFVNKDNPLEKISLDQLDAIFSSTRHRGGKPITTWGQLGLTGEWANKTIHLYGVKPWSGFEEFPRQRVLSRDGRRGEWRDGITWDADGYFLNPRRVAADRYGIGYGGLSHIDSGVRLLPLSESENGPFYAPTYENVALARYPLSRLVFFSIHKVPATPPNPVLEEFLRFILSKEGQQIVLNYAIYLPLRSEQVDDARAILSGVSQRSKFFLTVPYNVGRPSP